MCEQGFKCRISAELSVPSSGLSQAMSNMVGRVGDGMTLSHSTFLMCPGPQEGNNGTLESAS